MELEISMDIEENYTNVAILMFIPIGIGVVLNKIFDAYDSIALYFLVSSIYQFLGFALLICASYGSHIFDLKSKIETKIEHKGLFKMGILLMCAGFLTQILTQYNAMVMVELEYSNWVKNIISFVNSTPT